jgi:hypothetical protein
MFYWATTYHDFSRFPGYKRLTAWIACVTTRCVDVIHSRFPIFSIRKNPPTFADAKPYGAIMVFAMSDVVLALVVARRHQEVNRYIVLGIVIGVGILKTTAWNRFTELIAVRSPFAARHLSLITAGGAIGILIASEAWARWREKQKCKKIPTENACLIPEGAE